jgi:hypothetical protein
MFHDELIPDSERQKFHDAFNRLADAVQACLRMFLWVMEEVQRKAYEDGRDVHAVPIMLMFDLAEAIDGVSVLVRSGSSKNCSQLLRTALEVQLSLKYLMEHKDTYERRCLAYEYYHLLDRQRWAQRCDANSELGKRLRTELAGDQFADIFDLQNFDAADECRQVQARMDSARYADVRTELARMKAAKTRGENWFSLWSGPNNVRSLALHLKLGSIYESLYRGYSSVTHGEGAMKRVTGKRDERLELDPLRSPRGLPAMCRNACQICNSVTLFMVDGLVPHVREEMRQRYINDIKPGLEFIDSVKGLSG